MLMLRDYAKIIHEKFGGKKKITYLCIINQKVRNMQDQWDIIIDNKRRLFSLDLKEVWRYRDLVRMYVKRDIVTFYKQTILGPVWFFIQPVLTTIMFMFVFGGIAGISTDGVPQAVFYLAGLVCWN